MSYENSTDPSQGQGSTTQTAKDQASSVAQGAQRSGGRLAGEAKNEAGEIGREAGRQAKGLVEQGRTQVTEQASTQQHRLAEGLHSLSSELGSMADGAEQPGMATDLVRQVATRADSAAGWLDQRDPGDLLEEVKTFARTRPGLFIAIAAGAGLLAGRLTRGMKEVSSDGGSSSSGSGGSGGSHRAPGAPSTPPSAAPAPSQPGSQPAARTGPDGGTTPERSSAYGAAAGVSSYGTGAATGAGGAGGADYGTGPAYGSTASSGAAGSPGTAGGVPTSGVREGETSEPTGSPWPPVNDEGEQR